MRFISITFVAWYICGVFALLVLATTVVSYGSAGGGFGTAFGVGSLVASLLSANIAIVFARLPSSNWVHQSRLLFAAAILGAIIATLVLLLMGIG